MATVIAVHGTFAHIGVVPADSATQRVADAGATVKPLGDPIGETQWWEPDSSFAAEVRTLVEAEDGELRFEPFVWDGANSESSRRAAGRRLLQQAGRLEAERNPYVMVGHSHGGSVISWALMEAVANRKKLSGLKRWLSVGTPFVNLRKETLLFSRIPLMLQAVYVALLLFVVMFLLPLTLGVAAGADTRDRYMSQIGLADIASFDGIATLALTTLVISSVFILFYIFLVVMDRRLLHMHSRRNIQRARAAYGPSWLALTHDDDEAVQGLRSLGTTSFSIFDRAFFVPVFTALAVFALPVAYLVVLFTPSAMVGITELLKTHVYNYQAALPLVVEAKQVRDELRGVRRDARDSRFDLRSCYAAARSAARQQTPAAKAASAQRADPTCSRLLAAMRRYRDLRIKQPDLPRTLRFEASYLDPSTGQLQGGGRDTRINSWLLFNLINDSVNRAVGLDRILGVREGPPNRGSGSSSLRRIAQLAVPALLVPLAFALSAIVVLFLVARVGGIVSSYIARAFDAVTWSQIRRTALGNDTSTEIADKAVERPYWLDRSYPYLPDDLAQKISEQSNRTAAQSIGKLRNAISSLAFADGGDDKQGSLAQYFTWKELVHSSYFDVPAFRKLIAYSIAMAPGFRPSAAFHADPEFAQVAAWYEHLIAAMPAAETKA